MASRANAKLKPPPAKVYVYYCAACGRPVLADLTSKIWTDCPRCPLGKGRIRAVTYELGSPNR